MIKNNETTSIIENNISAAIMAAQGLIDDRSQQFGAHDSDVLFGVYEFPDAETGSYLEIMCDPNDMLQNVGYTFMLNSRRGGRGLLRSIAVSDGRLELSYNGNDPTVLYAIGRGFGNRIGPKRQIQTIGYSALLLTAIESQLD